MAEEYKFEQVRDLYLECLKEEGYVPKLDEEGDIYFKKEGRKFIVALSETDLQYLSLSATSSHDNILRSRCHALEVINDIQFHYKAVKMLLFEGDDLYIAFKVENFLESPITFENVLLRSLDLLGHIMNQFEKSVAKYDLTQQSSA